MKNKFFRLKITFLYLFIFSLPYEYYNPFGISEFFTISKMLGLFYFTFSLLEIKNFSLSEIKAPILLLISIWLLLLFQSILNFSGGSTSVYSLSFLQNIGLVLLLANDLKNNPHLIKGIFISLIVGVFMMGTLVSFGIGLGIEENVELGEHRLSFFGSNPNQVGNFAAIAAFIAVHMVLSKDNYFKKRTWLLLFIIPSLVTLISFSGSRGAIVTIALGFLVLVLFKRGNIRQKLVSIIIGLVGALFMYSRLLESAIIQRRIEDTASVSSFGGRMDIWRNAVEIFYDYPLFGLGVPGFVKEMTFRMGEMFDTHNLFLYFMVTGGIVALCLFLGYVFSLFRKAVLYYKIKGDALLLAFFLIYLFLIFKSGGAINSKIIWILSAIVLGLGSSIHPKKFSLKVR